MREDTVKIDKHHFIQVTCWRVDRDVCKLSRVFIDFSNNFFWKSCLASLRTAVIRRYWTLIGDDEMKWELQGVRYTFSSILISEIFSNKRSGYISNPFPN